MFFKDAILANKLHLDFSVKKSWKVYNILELVHSNLCEPMKRLTNGGKKVFSSFY